MKFRKECVCRMRIAPVEDRQGPFLGRRYNKASDSHGRVCGWDGQPLVTAHFAVEEEKTAGGLHSKVSMTRMSCRQCVAEMDSTSGNSASRCGKEKTAGGLPAKVSKTCLSCRDVVARMDLASSHGASHRGEEKTAVGLPAKVDTTRLSCIECAASVQNKIECIRPFLSGVHSRQLLVASLQLDAGAREFPLELMLVCEFFILLGYL
ncbi:hypothetical protein CDL15_Pgr029174 [Punica granatum]|uniref:C2H2-type domain-containing protein n=1 Tax=Punica granatum TaxID=22663 RepID=A0A218XCZ5_PUNGR|nr:hypothetical protein CDL15_Pgr029174 [Punica granatum]